MGGATGNLAASGALGGGASGGFFAGLGKAFGAMPSFMRSIVGNLALSAVSSLFSKNQILNRLKHQLESMACLDR